ncbi:MAG: outer membrane protein assembly factor BamE [Burkholderiaceae bacterium]|nr:MAG: outer membrane protein assembly factor BamE [Burkholderiaceae bacterium]
MHMRIPGLALLTSLALSLGACDQAALDNLKVGVSTEADVIKYLGQPERIWPESGGARTFEYDRQPQGVRNYMVTIGADGRMTALEQVLTPANFARVQPGMDAEAVQRLLGKPARKVPYKLKNQIVWTWKFLEPPNETKGFDVVFGPNERVISSAVGPNPDGPDSVGGG